MENEDMMRMRRIFDQQSKNYCIDWKINDSETKRLEMVPCERETKKYFMSHIEYTY